MYVCMYNICMYECKRQRPIERA